MSLTTTRLMFSDGRESHDGETREGVKSGIEADGDEEGRLRWAADEGEATGVDLSRRR